MSDNTIDFKPRTVLPAGTLISLCTMFLKSLQSMGRKQNTLISYKCDLEQFVGFAASRDIRLIMHVNDVLIEDWIQALTLGEGMLHRTAARKLETVKSFIKFCMRRNVLAFNPAEGIDIKFNVPRVIAPPEEKLLEVIDAIPTTGTENIRDRALLRIMFDGALRIGGLLGLDIYDEKDMPQTCVAPDGVVYYLAKGGDVKRTVVDETTLALLDEWMTTRKRFINYHKPASDRDALCLSRRGTRMTRAALHARIKKHGARVGMPELHSHLFRHRRLGEVYEKTGDLRLAADLGGHRSIQTFADIYGHNSGEVQRQRIRRDAPLGGVAA